MKKELSAKAKLIMGILELVIMGILTSYLLVEYQKDWIMLMAILISVILFSRCFTCEEIEQPIYNKLSNKTNVVSLALIFVAMMLLPGSAGGMITKSFQGEIYFVSFICWFVGLYFQEIHTKYKDNRI